MRPGETMPATSSSSLLSSPAPTSGSALVVTPGGAGVLIEWLLVGLGILLTLGTAVFVASEFSLVTLDPGLVESQTSPDDRRSQSVLKALRRLSTELSGAQLGITLTTVLLGYTTQPAVVRLLQLPLEESVLGQVVGGIVAGILAIILVNGFSMVVGELIPKNLAISRPLPTARMVAPLQRGFTSALRPLIVAFNGSANALLRSFGVEPREELSGGRSPQELAALVRRSAEVGTLDESTATLLTNSIEFTELTAVDVMTDRLRLVVVRREESAADVVDLARRTGHSRFPVIGDSSDDIVGLVHLRRAIGVPYERRSDVPAAALMVEAPRVPETVHLGPLLVELRELGLQMAVVVDEYGGTSGRRHARGRRRGARRGRRRRARPPTRLHHPRRPTARGCCPACCAPTSWRRSPGCTSRRTAPTRPSAGC